MPFPPHVIYPMNVKGGSKDNDGDEKKGTLAIDGFDINPIIAPRLDCEYGDVYGRGLEIDGLRLVKTAK